MNKFFSGVVVCAFGVLIVLAVLRFGSGFSLAEEPFHGPAASNDISAMKALLDGGLDVNALDDNGDTAITYALDYGNIEMAEFLLARGAKLDIPDREGRSLPGKIRRNGPDRSVNWLGKHGH